MNKFNYTIHDKKEEPINVKFELLGSQGYITLRASNGNYSQILLSITPDGTLTDYDLGDCVTTVLGIKTGKDGKIRQEKI